MTIINEEKELKYHRPYKEESLQHAPRNHNQIGTEIERTPRYSWLNRLNNHDKKRTEERGDNPVESWPGMLKPSYWIHLFPGCFRLAFLIKRIFRTLPWRSDKEAGFFSILKKSKRDFDLRGFSLPENATESPLLNHWNHTLNGFLPSSPHWRKTDDRPPGL